MPTVHQQENSCLSSASVTRRHGIHSITLSSRKVVHILTFRRLASRTGLCKTQLGEMEEWALKFFCKSLEWKPHFGSETHKFKSSFCLLKLRSGTYSPSSGESYCPLAVYGSNLQRSCPTQELNKEHVRREHGTRSTAARGKRLLHWSCSSSGDSHVHEAERTNVHHKNATWCRDGWAPGELSQWI